MISPEAPEPPKHHYFFKYCIICDKKFRPTGRSNKICEDCNRKTRWFCKNRMGTKRINSKQ